MCNRALAAEKGKSMKCTNLPLEGSRTLPMSNELSATEDLVRENNLCFNYLLNVLF